MAIWLHSVDCGVSSKELRVEKSSYYTILLSSGGNLIHFYGVNLTPLLKFNKNIKSKLYGKEKVTPKRFLKICSETWFQEVA